MVSCPARLSCIVAAIFSVVPLYPSTVSEQVSTAFVSFSKSAGDALIIANIPDIASRPKSEAAACACSASVSPPSLSRICPIKSRSEYILPELSVKEIPYFSIAEDTVSVGLARLTIAPRKAVPACEDLIPAFAISPIAIAESSAEYPKEPNTGAAYLKVSPIMLTLVLALELAAARISAKCPLSSAFNPNAVRASVTMSDVVAKSSPDAAARFIMPSIPLSISLVFQPAIAM